MDGIPRTATGKVARASLRNLGVAERDGASGKLNWSITNAAPVRIDAQS
jgi:hypothetical protein